MERHTKQVNLIILRNITEKPLKLTTITPYYSIFNIYLRVLLNIILIKNVHSDWNNRLRDLSVILFRYKTYWEDIISFTIEHFIEDYKYGVWESLMIIPIIYKYSVIMF